MVAGMIARWSLARWSRDHLLHGALVVVVAFAVEWSPAVAPAVAPVATATGCPLVVAWTVAAAGRLPMVAPVAPVGPVAVACEVADATNRPGRMPPRLPLLQRRGRTVRLPPQRMLSILHVPALPVLDRLLHRPVPGTATLDRGWSLAQLPRPLRPQQLGRAGVGTLAPRLHAQQLAPLLCQVGVGLLVGLVLLLPVAGVALTVGGTVGGLPGDLVGRLGLLGLLPGAAKVAPTQPPGRAMLHERDQVAGVLASGGRLGKSLVVLFAPAGRQVKQAGLVGWGVVDGLFQAGQLGAQVVLAHALPVQHLGAVGGQALAAVAAGDRGHLVGLLLGGAVGGGHVHHLTFPILAAGGLGADHAVVAGPPDPAAPPDVQPLAVFRAGHPQQHVIPGAALRLVPGGGVGKVHGAPVGVVANPARRPLVQVLSGQGHLAAILQLERHRPLLKIDRDDLAAAAVGHPKGLDRVLAAHHLVAHREATIPHGKPLRAELAFLVAELLAGAVELVHLIAAVGQDHHAVAVLE